MREQGEKKKGKKRIIIVGVCAIMVALVGVALAKKPKTEDTIGGFKDGMRVTVERVTKGDIQAKISTSGKLEAKDTVVIYADTSNKVLKKHKEVGDMVNEGDIILTMDKEVQVRAERDLASLEAKLAAAKQTLNEALSPASKQDILDAQASLAETENKKLQVQTDNDTLNREIKVLNDQLTNLKEDLKLQQDLVKEGLETEKSVKDLEVSIETKEKEIEQKKADIESNNQSLTSINALIESGNHKIKVLLNEESDPSKAVKISDVQSTIKDLETQIANKKLDIQDASTEVKAPISGIITTLPDQEGMSVSEGTELVTIVDPTELKVTCDISPYYASDLKKGLKAEIKYTGSSTIEVEGEVTKVSATAVTKTTNSKESTVIPVEVTIKEPGDILKPGFSVDVKVVTDARENVCVIPLLDVLDEEDRTYVYTVNEETGELAQKDVVEGISSGLNIEVSGLEEGEMIVNNPGDYLVPGDRVSYEKLPDQLGISEDETAAESTQAPEETEKLGDAE